MFVDKESIIIKAGDGGDGATSFIRYKGVAYGGPDGGDGGKGGDVVFVGDKNKTSLIDFQFKHKYFAENGAKGDTKNCTGRCGEDIVIPLPLGTVIKDSETGNIICDVFYHGQRITVLQGGFGGKGNKKFCTSRRHAPHFSQKGEKTEIKRVVLELKMIADVGLLGFPNVGKSTLLSKISGAKPKIANYHFTTLSPNLGVVRHGEEDFVVADIPGLIEGAAQGAGLGHEFLRHVERTRMLVHVVDISGVEGRDPLEDFKQINSELKDYSEKLASVLQIVALNKADIAGADENIARFTKKYGKKYEIVKISALSGDGVKELLDKVSGVLKTLPKLKPIEFEPFVYEKKNTDEFEVVHDDEGYFAVIGPLVDLLSRNVVLDDQDSIAYFQKTLRDKGVISALRSKGAKDGDTVVIGEIEFDFVE
ncbi:MAG: GTPase ObgE [Candidatus Borkfalkiaceae bacterium]|nr:GTPase ObgE [Christensenellaceae bacterium]